MKNRKVARRTRPKRTKRGRRLYALDMEHDMNMDRQRRLTHSMAAAREMQMRYVAAGYKVLVYIIPTTRVGKHTVWVGQIANDW